MVEKRPQMTSLERLIRQGSDEDIRRFFLLLRPADMADVLEASSEEDRIRVLRLMQAPLASEVLVEMQEDDREEIFEELSPGGARRDRPRGAFGRCRRPDRRRCRGKNRRRR